MAAQLDRSVLILSTRGRRDADALVTGLAARCDGLVVLGPTVDDEVVHRLNRRGTPIVLVARTPLIDVDSVNAENNASGSACWASTSSPPGRGRSSSSATPTRRPT